jgi:hypothetical protein
MIRVLLMIAVAGFILSVGAIAAAVAIGGPDIMSRGGWTVARHWDGDWDWHEDSRHSGEMGAETTRTLEWSGADSLDIDLPADVRYVQADGPATVVVTGPERLVSDVVVRGDSIRYERRRHSHHGKVSIVIRAPSVQSFDLSGRSTLAIEDYRQERLALDASGMAEVTARGEVGEIDLDISGRSDVDLAELKTRGARVDISGDGEVTIAPTDWAKMEVSGMGEIRLTTRPKSLETDISGAGKVRELGPNDARDTPPSPPGLPTPPKSSKL